MIGEVVGEVVVVRIAVDLDEMVVLDDAMRLVQVRERVEDPVEAVEPALAGPRVLRARGGAVRVLRQVPLPHHHRGVARLVAEDLGDRRHVRPELHRVPGESRIEVRDRPEPGPVRLEPGEQRGAGRRAHRRSVEVRGADATRGQRIEVRRVDLRAVAAEVRKAEVVREHHHDVRCARWWRRPRRPRTLRARERPTDVTFEPRIRARHRCWCLSDRQTRSGSTAIRSRPSDRAAGAVAASASQSASTSGARRRRLEPRRRAGRPEDVDLGIRPEAIEERGDAPRPRRAPRPARRTAGTRAPRVAVARLRPRRWGRPAGPLRGPRGRAGASGRGGGHRRSAARAGARPAPAGRVPARPPGNAARAAPGRSRGTRRGPAGARAGAGATRLRYRRRPGRRQASSVEASTSTTSTRGSSAARSSRTRATPGRSAFIRVAWQCRQTIGRSSPQLAHCSCRFSVSLTNAPHRSQRASSLHATQARSRARPRRLSSAHRPFAPINHVVQRGGQRRGEQPGPGRVVARVHDLDDRPAVALDRPVGPDRRAADGLGLEGGRGGDQGQRRAAAPGALDRDVTSVPRRGPLLLQRLVTLVEDDHRGEIRHRRPHRDPTADDDAAARRGPRPRPGCARRRSRCRAARACGARRARAACATRRAAPPRAR